MIISIIGHGYVGLVSAAVFADLGNTVWCVGRNPQKIELLKSGIIPFFEPGLEEIVKRNIRAKRLRFTINYKEAISTSEIIFICVGTPPKRNDEADLSSVFQAVDSIGKHLKDKKTFTLLVTKSTVPIGTNKRIKEILNSQFSILNSKFDVASCPEFLREGTAVSDTLHPDRIVIGYQNPKSRDLLLELHKPIDGQVVLTSIESAEMIKYAANACLSTKISFANAIAFLCEKIGADVEEVLDGVGLDKRIGRSFLYPGIGYGGSCFPKDVKALIAISQSLSYNFKLLKAVDEINNQAKEIFIDKIVGFFKKNLKGKRIGVLGLAFKPNTDDLREAPSLFIIKKLIQLGTKIKAYDPVAMSKARRLLPGISFVNSPYELAKAAQALLILTEWNEFRQLDLKKIKRLMEKPVIFDGRNIYDPKKIRNLGFYYQGVGR